MNVKKQIIFYAGLGLIFFIFWFFIVFPYDALQSRIINEFENRFAGLYKVDSENVDLSLFGSVTLRNFKLHERVQGQYKPLLVSPRLKLGFSPFVIFSKQPSFSFYFESKDGDLDGSFEQDGSELKVKADFDDFSLEAVPYIMTKSNIVLVGILNGSIDLDVDTADPNKNSGKIDIDLEKLSLDPSQMVLDPNLASSGIVLPKLTLAGEKGSHIQGALQKNEMNLTSVVLAGGDIDLNLSGKITLLGANFKDYRLSLNGTFKLAEAFAKALPILFVLEQQKNAQGVYPLQITGRIGKPSIRIGTFKLPL